MKITKTSAFTGTTRTRDLPVSEVDYGRWARGEALLQDAFPHLNADDREFIKTGITPEEWEQIYPEEEDNE